MYLRDRIRNYFSNLRLRYSILVAWFVLTGLFFISTSSIVASQVIYSRTYFINHCLKLLDDEENKHLELIALNGAKKIEDDFEFYYNYIKVFAGVEKRILEGEPLVVSPNPIFNEIPGDMIDINDPTGHKLLNRSYFFSQTLGISDPGYALMKKQAAFDYFYQFMVFDAFLSIYIGFKTDRILNVYPGLIYQDLNYDPTVREWYYRAENEMGNPTMTEPYLDFFNGEWLITISQALVANNEVYAVVGADVKINSFSFNFLNMSIMDGGFYIYITNDGYIINSVTNFNQFNIKYPASHLEIGINNNMWKDMQNPNISTSHVFFFNDPSGNSYKFTRAIGYSRLYTNRQFYILACVSDDRNLQFLYTLPNLETEYIFLFSLITIVIVAPIMLLIYRKSIKTFERKIKSIFMITKTCVKKLFAYSQEDAEKIRTEIIKYEFEEVEEIYNSRIMNVTQNLNPISDNDDKFIYNQLEEFLFPKCIPVKMKWTSIISDIEDYKTAAVELVTM